MSGNIRILHESLPRCLAALFCAWAFLGPGVEAATHEVTVGGAGNTFSPSTLNIRVGDTVHWTWANGGHTVTSGDACAADGRFSSGDATSPGGSSFSFTFQQPGSFPYFCVPHCSFGMRGVVNVAGAGPVAGNKAPKLKLTPSNNSPNKKSRKIDEGETETITAVASDPNGDEVFLDAAGLPPGALWTPASGKRAVGRFVWTPDAGTATSQPEVTVVFSATDSPRSGARPLTRTQAVTLTVGQNARPRLIEIATPPAIVGKPMRLAIKAFDPDRDKLMFLPTAGLPEGASFRPRPSGKGNASGIFKWKPRADQAGREFRVTFTVQDNFVNPAQDSMELVFTVAAR